MKLNVPNRNMGELIAQSLGGKMEDGKIIVPKEYDFEGGKTQQKEPIQPKIEEEKVIEVNEDKEKIEADEKAKIKASEDAADKQAADSEKNKSSLTKSFEELLEEKSGGKFKSWEDAEKAITPKTEFANDLVSKFNDFSKKFENPKQALDLFLTTQTTDFTKLSEIDSVKMKIRMDNPELTEKEIDHEFKTTYKLDEAEYDAETIELSQLKLTREAKKAQTELLEMQQELALNGDKDPVKTKAEQDRVDSERNKWIKSIDDYLPSLEKMDIKISEKDNLEWKYSHEEIKESVEMAKITFDDTTKFFEIFKNDKGEYDTGKIASAYLKLKKFDEILGAAIEQARNSGAKKEIQDLKNTDFEAAKNKGGQKPALSIAEQVAKKILG